ncbi:GH3 auxin-responsive promoter family protein [Nannocystis sp.]|uniref:GH3 family domain-containing protein n=1 Tax=Nannocystis sp. TaxID=1962667 RepID=UPI00344D2835|nr:GH3 auxin-responsive promoter family protein [Nannocystis sp.]
MSVDPFGPGWSHGVDRVRARQLLRGFDRGMQVGAGDRPRDLREILADNAGTEVRTNAPLRRAAARPAAWRRAVPLLRHGDLAPAIDRMARGEQTLVAERVDFFAQDLGVDRHGQSHPDAAEAPGDLHPLLRRDHPGSADLRGARWG